MLYVLIKTAKKPQMQWFLFSYTQIKTFIMNIIFPFCHVFTSRCHSILQIFKGWLFNQENIPNMYYNHNYLVKRTIQKRNRTVHDRNQIMKSGSYKKFKLQKNIVWSNITIAVSSFVQKLHRSINENVMDFRLTRNNVYHIRG